MRFLAPFFHCVLWYLSRRLTIVDEHEMLDDKGTRSYVTLSIGTRPDRTSTSEGFRSSLISAWSPFPWLLPPTADAPSTRMPSTLKPWSLSWWLLLLGLTIRRDTSMKLSPLHCRYLKVFMKIKMVCERRGWKGEIYCLKPFIKLHLVESKLLGSSFLCCYSLNWHQLERNELPFMGAFLRATSGWRMNPVI